MDWTSVCDDDGDGGEFSLPHLLQTRSTRAADEQTQKGGYSTFVAYSFTLNYILGVGCLGLPKAIEKAGVVLGISILFLVTCLTMLTVNWLVEVLYRAQILSSHSHFFDAPHPYNESPLKFIYRRRRHTHEHIQQQQHQQHHLPLPSSRTQSTFPESSRTSIFAPSLTSSSSSSSSSTTTTSLHAPAAAVAVAVASDALIEDLLTSPSPANYGATQNRDHHIFIQKTQSQTSNSTSPSTATTTTTTTHPALLAPSSALYSSSSSASSSSSSSSSSASSSSSSKQRLLSPSPPASISHGKRLFYTLHANNANHAYEISQIHEVVQLCDMFLGRYYTAIYQASLCILMVAGLWAYTTVFASSMLGQFTILGCDYGKQQLGSLDESCEFAYLTLCVVFGIIVVPLSCMDLTEQVLVQLFLTMARFVTIGLMIGSAILAMWTDYPDSGLSFSAASDSASASANVHAPFIYSLPSSFDGLSIIFTTAVFSQLFQHSVPGLVAPLVNKKQIRTLFSMTLVTTLFLYATLGAAGALYFGSQTNASINLNWRRFTWGYTEKIPTVFRVLNCLIVLFPAFDTISVYPLISITLGNSLFASFHHEPAPHSSSSTAAMTAATIEAAKQHHDKHIRAHRLKLVCRVVASLPPILAATTVRDLTVILQVGGIVGVFIAIVTPALLQLSSIKAYRSVLPASQLSSRPSSFVVSTVWSRFSSFFFFPLDVPKSPYVSFFSKAPFVYGALVIGTAALVITAQPLFQQ